MLQPVPKAIPATMTSLADVVENAFVHSDSGDSLKILVEKAIGKHLGEEINL